MNIFLTGAVQGGKSTVIDRFLALSGLRPTGFRTTFGDTRELEHRSLYICPAGAAPVWDEAHTAVTFQGRQPRIIPGVFDSVGVECLKMPGDIAIMDELGRFERDELAFQQTVLDVLDSPVPVLGVLRTGKEIPWLDRIKSRSDVTLVAVTQENRDELPEMLLEMFEEAKKVE